MTARSRAREVTNDRKNPATPHPRTTLRPLTAGNLKTAILKIITASPTVRASEKSRKNCLFGWDRSEAESTTEASSNFRRAKAPTKATRRIDPKVTGGRVTRKGQTCPPYMVRTETAKR